MNDITQLSDEQLNQIANQSRPDITKISDEDLMKMSGSTSISNPQYDKFIPEFLTEINKGFPLAQRTINSPLMSDEDRKGIVNRTAQVPKDPKTFMGKFGQFTGSIVNAAPAISGWEAAGLKGLGSAALGFGSQVFGQDLSEGKSFSRSGGEGAFTAGVTFAGGKALEGAGKLIMKSPELLRGVAGRIHDMIVKLPTKSMNYGKDPLNVLAEEKIVASDITDYAQKAQERLDLRTKELNEAVSGNKTKVDLSKIANKHFENAVRKSEGSLKNREGILQQIEYLRDKLAKTYGDLKNLTVEQAVALKRQLADDFPFSANSEENYLAKVMHQFHHEINVAIEKEAPKVSKLNQKVSSLIDISKAARNRLAVEARNNPIGLIGTILGTGVGAGIGFHQGGFKGSVEGGIGTVIAMKALSSPAVLTRIANALSVMADVDKIKVSDAYPFLKEKFPNLFGQETQAQSPQFTGQPQVGFNPQLSLPAPKDVPFNPSGQRNVIGQMNMPFSESGPTIQGQAPYSGTTMPAVIDNPQFRNPDFSSAKKFKTKGSIFRSPGEEKVFPKSIIELKPRSNIPDFIDKKITTKDAIAYGDSIKNSNSKIIELKNHIKELTKMGNKAMDEGDEKTAASILYGATSKAKEALKAALKPKGKDISSLSDWEGEGGVGKLDFWNTIRKSYGKKK